MTWLSGPTRCARRLLTWSVSPAGAGAWQSALQIRPRPRRGAGYRSGLRISWVLPPCDRQERGTFHNGHPMGWPSCERLALTGYTAEEFTSEPDGAHGAVHAAWPH